MVTAGSTRLSIDVGASHRLSMDGRASLDARASLDHRGSLGLQRLLGPASRAGSVVGALPVFFPTERRSWPRRAIDGVKEALRRRQLVREVSLLVMLAMGALAGPRYLHNISGVSSHAVSLTTQGSSSVQDTDCYN